MRALNNAAVENNTAAVKSIIASFRQMIEKTQDTTALIQGLNEKQTSGDDQGTNGWYWLMKALEYAASKNNAELGTLSQTLQKLVQKNSNKTLLPLFFEDQHWSSLSTALKSALISYLLII